MDGTISIRVLNVIAEEQTPATRSAIGAATQALSDSATVAELVEAVAYVLGVTGEELWSQTQARPENETLTGPLVLLAADDLAQVVRPIQP